MTKEPNPGFAGGIAKRGPIQRLAWQLKGAPPRRKDLRLSPLAAIAEGRKLRDRVTENLLNAEAEPEDARVYCVFADAAAFSEPPVGKTEEDIAAFDASLDTPRPAPKLARLRVNNGASDIKLANEFLQDVPVGFLILLWDRELWASNSLQKFVEWSIRPLLVEHNLASGINSFAMRSEKNRIEERLKKAGGVFPDDED